MLDRRTPPISQTIDQIHIIKAQTSTLSNGMRLHVLNAGDLDILRIELIFEAGNIQEEKNGVSFFTSKMLGEGTSKHTSAEISEYIDRFGAFIDFNHGAERISIGLYSLSKHLEKLLPMLQDILMDSVFPEKELSNLKNITLQNLKVNEEKNNYIASKKFRELLFGAAHPYGKNLDEQVIEQVYHSDLIQHYNKHIKNQPFEVILVGKINQKEIDLVNECFGTLTIAPKTEKYLTKDVQTSSESKSFFPKADSLQSSIRIGKIFFPKNHPDYFEMAVVNEIFGGYFGSRLMKNIREQKGFTYGIYSSLSTMKHTGYLSIATDVKAEFTQKTIDEIHKESQKLRTELVSSEELETVRNYMLGAFAGSMNTSFDLAEVFKSIYFNDLDYSYYDKYMDTLKTITAENILEMAQKYLHTEEMLEVVVGAWE